MAFRKKVSIVKTMKVEMSIFFVPDRHYLGAAGVAPLPGGRLIAPNAARQQFDLNL